jgi:hypothetical protein
MTDDVANLILEHLPVMRGELAEVKRRIANVEIEQVQTRKHMALLVEGQSHILNRMAEFEAKLDRIERRLELRDEAPTP